MFQTLLLHAILFIHGIQGGFPVPPQSGLISGQVVHPDGTPAAGVRVTAVEADGTNGLSSFAVTDSNGRYRLERMPAGRYVLVGGRIETGWYFPGVAARKEATVITVKDAADQGSFDFKIGFIVRGRVRHEGGNPPSNAEFVGQMEWVDPYNNVFKARQGEDGAFELSYLSPGVHRLLLGNRPLSEITVRDRDVLDLEITIPPNVAGRFVVDNGALPRMATFMYRKGECGGPIDFGCDYTTTVPVQPDGTFKIAIPQEWGTVTLTGGLPDGYVLRSFTYGAFDLLDNGRARAFPIPQAEMVLTLSRQ